MQIQIGAIIDNTETDGPGLRTSVYTSGCSVRCPGCQNEQLFDATYGVAWDVAALAERLLAPGLPISILGGEPFDQAMSVASLIAALRRSGRLVGPLIVYTGYVFEKLLARATASSGLVGAATDAILRMTDILVDGPFMGKRDDEFVQYRGSRNQRPIDMVATLEQGFGAAPIVLNWDRQRIVIRADGSMLGTAGMINLIAVGAETTAEDARRCGQTK